MKGSVYRRCFCRDDDGRALGRKCPRLRAKAKGHGKWYFRYDAPRGAGDPRRQPEVGPFETEKDAEEKMAAVIALLGGGDPDQDRDQKVAGWLTSYADGKIDVKPRTQEAIREAIALYWIPALGHLRLAELRSRHITEAVLELTRLNRPLPPGGRQSETGRRLMAARADDARKVLPDGEARRKRSAKPLSPARVKRVFAVLHAALAVAAAQEVIRRNPCDGVVLPRHDRVRPLAWTAQREAAFTADLRRREAAAGNLTTVARQRLWASADLRPGPVMVWMPGHTGEFLDYLDRAGERLAALFCLVAYCGLRRGEVTGLAWSEIDLDRSVITIRRTGSGDGPKSAAGFRAVPLPALVVTALRAWRKAQLAERLAWGADWTDTGLAFTREDGTALRDQWVSVRFETLAFRAALPPVRFHDLRHGAASLCKAAGLDSKHISALLGHSRTAFTDDVYVTLFPEVASAGAELAAAVVPRRAAGGASGP